MKHSFKSFLSENYQQQATGDEISELAKTLVRDCSKYNIDIFKIYYN